jgi:outer membrane receptor protein involved in Fe transport
VRSAVSKMAGWPSGLIRIARAARRFITRLQTFTHHQAHTFTKPLAGLWPLTAMILCGGLAWAQEPPPTDLDQSSIEDLAKIKVDSANGASKFLHDTAKTPASVTIVTAAEIRRYGYRTLADVLRSVRGFYVIYDRNYSYAGVRGLSRPGDYNARILFLLDGHRINDNIFDGAYVGTEFPVSMDLIDHIEIIRGPSSSVYGTGAFIAVINVITKRGRDVNAVEVTADAESWNSYKGKASYGARFDNGLETLVSGSFYNSQGHPQLFFPEFNSPATNNGIAAHADADQSYSAFADIIYRDFDIHVVEASRTKHIPTASFRTVFNDPRTQTTDARSYLDAQYRHVFGTWEALGRLSYDWYDYHGIYVYDYAGKGVPPFTENYDLANGTWWDFQWDASRVFFKRHRVTLGTEIRQDLRQRQANYDLQPYVLYLDDHRTSLLWGYYFQDEFSIRKNLTLVAGLRDDWYDKHGNHLSPRVGLIFSPTPATDLKGSFSHAFRVPNSYETYYASSQGSSTNLSLRPEDIHAFELDLEHRFHKTYYVSAAGFLNNIDGLIEQTKDPVTGAPIYANYGTVRTKGIELEVGAKWEGGLESSISDSIQTSRDSATGGVLTNSPKNLAKLNLSLPLIQEKLFASIEAQNTSRRRTIAGTDLGSFFLMNLTLYSRKLWKDVEISAGLYNAFNKQYADSGSLDHQQASIPQDGRNFRVKLTFRAPLRSK